MQMSPLSHTLATMFGVLLLAMLLLWVLGTLRRDVSIVDVFWGLGFVIVAWLALYMNTPVPGRSLLLAVLTTVWGMRLSLYLLWRNWNQGEDRRYATMRRRHGRHFWWVSLFTVFLLQAVILWFVSLPIQVCAALSRADHLGVLDIIGVALWSIGFLFEAGGDYQLARFKTDPENHRRVMDQGLWRYTRHPNYFGDFCVWWGIYFIAAAGGAWWTVVSPLLMTYLLLQVSGVKLTETSITDRRPEYRAYIDRTNAFFPGPRKIK